MKTTSPQLALFDRLDETPEPSGLAYRPDFITPTQERELIECIRELDLAPFQFGEFEGKRRVASFGWHYNYSTQNLETADPFPTWILPTISAVETTAQLREGAIAHVLFTVYEAGAGIGWHRDKKQFDQVFGLSLGAACNFRFRRKAGTKWERYTLQAEPRSLYTMSGDARSQWEHSIPPVEALRYSVTLRTMVDADASL